MACLADLPNELLLNIILNIPTHRDVVSLALQSRRFPGLCDFAVRRKFRRVRVAPDASKVSALKMLLRVIKQPQLGHYVEHLELDINTDLHPPTAVLDKNELLPSDVELLEQAINNAGFLDSYGDWTMLDALFPYEDSRSYRTLVLRSKSLELLAALLASVSPNLESISCGNLGLYLPKVQAWREGLEIRKYPNRPIGSLSYFGQFLQRSSLPGCRSPHLQRLKRVQFLSQTIEDVDGRLHEEVDYYHCFNVIRRLPAIDSVAFDGTISSRQNMSVRPPPRSGNYSKIEFRYSSLRTSVLNSIIHSSKALRELTLSNGSRDMVGGHRLGLHELFDALLVHRETLEHLHIDAEDDIRVYEYLDESRIGPVPSFADEVSEEEQVAYEEEWAEELSLPATAHIDHDNLQHERPRKSIRSLHRLKYIGMGIYTLYYLAQGIGEDKIARESFSVVDQLPEALETLRLYGYVPWTGNPIHVYVEEPKVDGQLSQLLRQKETKLPHLKAIEGLRGTIVSGGSVNGSEGEDAPVEGREKEEWSEYEY